MNRSPKFRTYVIATPSTPPRRVVLIDQGEDQFAIDLTDEEMRDGKRVKIVEVEN